LPQDDQLCNLVDAIADQIDSTTYKLRFLKWQPKAGRWKAVYH
jgi:hypothetical protein